MSNAADSESGHVAFKDSESLFRIFEDCWTELQRAVDDRSSGWRLPVLATAEASACRQRVVVLRAVDARPRTLFAHTDVRSAKVESIRQQSLVSWLFYDVRLQSQLQLQGTATIHTDDETADRFWQSEPESSLRGYLAPHAPGVVSSTADVNLPYDVRGRIPHRDELAAGRQNFAVISCVVHAAEWLLLRQSGNLRARFACENPGQLTAEWVYP